ncbi:glutamyl-tRNA reductase [uncultured Amnibacterium sp.]|uniref:glutamyl-tRNA reductase n=1 Tax=uncultured Amnibacterium sp. TaxID=1631851 RepID=UPI0035CAD958
MITALTADYRSAGFEVLERLATVSADSLARFAQQRPEVRGGVLLATCNRFEAYLDTDGDPASIEALIDFATSTAGVDRDLLAGAAVHREELEVAGHLFAVSSGLESLVVGEAEIAGQVSRALETARSLGTTTPALERLFQRASRTSSAVQQHTMVGTAGRNIVRLALDLAGSRFTDWPTTGVLLIGTGTYARATLAALRERGVEEIAVYSPSGRAVRFAQREGVVAVTRAELPYRLALADLVISCSIASAPILDADMLRRARAVVAEPARQLVVDLGMPRNIEPDVGLLPDVALLDLETIGLHAPLPELQATDDARALIAEAVEEYGADQRATAASPAVVAYRAHVFDLVDRELERLRRRGESTEAVERAMRHLAGVLVHTPSARARDLASAGQAERFADAVETLYGIVPATSDEQAATRTDTTLAG